MSFPNPLKRLFKNGPMPEADRRVVVRTYSQVPATLFAPAIDPVDCTLLDYSDMGARLQAPVGARFPDEFKLYVPETDMTYVAEVRRRAAKEVGVFFLSAEPGRKPWQARQ